MKGFLRLIAGGGILVCSWQQRLQATKLNRDCGKVKRRIRHRWVAAVALVTVAAFGVSRAAQGPATADVKVAQPGKIYPAPTNLKVLPKNSTGQQVHDTMKEWSDSMSVECSACHAEVPGKKGPDGKPLLNFADDSKPMKDVARMMYTMTDEINSSYIAKVEGSGLPVTCGTCHQGKISPEPYEKNKPQPKNLGPAPGEGPIPE